MINTLSSEEMKAFKKWFGGEDGIRYFRHLLGLTKTVIPVLHLNEMVDYWRFDKNHDENLFIDKKYAKSSLAMYQISQLLPYYGGAITEEEWEDENIFKYNIERYKNTVYLDGHSTMYTFLAFHTEEQRDSFYKNNKQLVHDYLMIE